MSAERRLCRHFPRPSRLSNLRFTFLLRVRNALERPDDDVLDAREVEERPLVRKRQLPRRHRVELDRRLGRLERPRRMVNLRAAEAPALVHGVEAGALDEELLERPRRGVRLLTPGPVPRTEDMRALPVPHTRRLDFEPL